MSEKELDEYALQNRIRDAKKTDDLLNKQGTNLIRPRAKDKPAPVVEQQSQPVAPEPRYEAQPLKPKKFMEESEFEIIKPRKKSQQNLNIVNVAKEEIEKTLTGVRDEYRKIDKVTKHEEKSLIKEKKQVEKKIDKLQSKAEKLISKKIYNEELEHTLEVKDNYVAAMKEINQHLTQIKSDYGEDISLGERRKQIYENSKLASTKRAQRLMYIRKLETEGKSLAKGNAKTTGAKSFYHQELEKQQSNSKFMEKRNPFYKRLKEVNDRGGVTVDATMPLEPDRVAERWNERKHNLDKNGHIKPKNKFVFPEEDE
jgi:hypothetical protein